MLARSADAGADSLRAVLDSVFAGSAYRWVERPDPWAPVRRGWLSLVEWIARLERDHPVAHRVLIWALVATLAALLLHGAWVMWRMMRASMAPGEPGVPLPPPRDAQWYRASAGRFAAAGQYLQAMQAEFTAVVLTLDQRRLVRFHPSKTPGEYAAERNELAALVDLLYRHLFARVPCGSEEYLAWRRRAAGALDATAP